MASLATWHGVPQDLRTSPKAPTKSTVTSQPQSSPWRTYTNPLLSTAPDITTGEAEGTDGSMVTARARMKPALGPRLPAAFISKGLAFQDRRPGLKTPTLHLHRAKHDEKQQVAAGSCSALPQPVPDGSSEPNMEGTTVRPTAQVHLGRSPQSGSSCRIHSIFHPG